MGFLSEHCSFSNLTPSLRSSLKGFVCTNEPEIEEFFGDECLLNDGQLLSRTYCFYIEETMEAVCAFCVMCSNVSIALIPKKTRNKLNRKIPYVKQRDHYPAVMVGQLAVFDKFASLHLGDELMQLIKLWIVTEAPQIAARYVLVDAVNKEKVLNYYKRNEFALVFPDEAEEIRFNELDGNEILRTRFMISDLLPIYNQVNNAPSAQGLLGKVTKSM